MSDTTPTKNESLPELLKCPGCGGTDTRVIGGPGTAGGPQHWAGCDHCRWRTWGNTEREAIEAWNTREAPTEGAIGLLDSLHTLVESLAADANDEQEKSQDRKWSEWVRDRHHGKSSGLAEAARRLNELLAATPHAPQRLAQGDDGIRREEGWCDGCPTHAELRRLLEKERGIVKRLVAEDDERFAQEQATTQPPHQDRGEVIALIERALLSAEEHGLKGAPFPIRSCVEQITAALTEAKQQGPGEAGRSTSYSREALEIQGARWRAFCRTLDHVAPGWDSGLFNAVEVASAAVRELSAYAARTALDGAQAPQVEAKRLAGGDA